MTLSCRGGNRLKIVYGRKGLLKSNDTNETPYDEVKQCRERKRMKAVEQINNEVTAHATEKTEAMQMDDVMSSTSTPDCRDIDCGRTPTIKDRFGSS
ncbi:hypothetical protein EVAR_88897_1 [Eumeta japonica]|uniref:Uncharacterized protein n=1 Tax=Eumeta variegata TaxID=151549 RepID=A0A4C1Y094_EUMVA|nr:hypothetical protein EVAR_88897_1 [Eumeta japonica]